MMENYGIIGWIVIGLLAGGIAKLLMPGRDPGGCIITISVSYTHLTLPTNREV